MSKGTPKTKMANTALTLKQVATIVHAKIIVADGIDADTFDANQTVNGLATLQQATTHDISFLANPKYQNDLTTTSALAVLVSQEMSAVCPVVSLVVADPYYAFALLSQYFEYQTTHSNTDSLISHLAYVDSTASIGEGVTIGHHASIGKHVVIGAGTQIASHVVIEDYAVIGSECHLASGVVIHHHCQLGDAVRVAANASIGAEGFGFAPVKPSVSGQSFHWERIAQLGAVRIGSHVSIGANTCIDRGALADTVVGEGVIIDNLVQIAHNVQIGDYTAIAACTGIAGSTKVGRYCIIGGGVGIAGHVEITDGVTISGGSNIFGNILTAGEYASGVRHMPTTQWRRAAVNFKQLAEYAPKKLATEINDLKKSLNALKSRLGE